MFTWTDYCPNKIEMSMNCQSLKKLEVINTRPLHMHKFVLPYPGPVSYVMHEAVGCMLMNAWMS
jgi:hypothetical protein